MILRFRKPEKKTANMLNLKECQRRRAVGVLSSLMIHMIQRNHYTCAVVARYHLMAKCCMKVGLKCPNLKCEPVNTGL